MYRALASLFEQVEIPVEELSMSTGGSWRARLDNGAVIEMGRGTVPEVLVRAQRFLKTLTQVTSRYGRQFSAVESADLRHENGYALRLRGVTTVAADAVKK
jgi:cell division protein FtsQ